MEPSTVTEDAPQEPSRRDGLFVISVCVAIFAVLIAVIGAGWAWRAIDESKTNVASAGASAEAMVSLTEFSVTPVTVGAGGSLMVMNEGSVAHNLKIEDTELATADIPGGSSETLQLGDLAPGTYTMICTIAGHKEAGMEATLTVAEGSGEVASDPTGGTGHEDMDYDAMTKSMTDSMSLFPAETEGVGNPVLEPTEVKADGTKVFDLVAAITKWERAPGDIVDAWTYNGVVPAPTIQLDIGDKVEFRLKNDLPIATDLHLHGLNVDNAYDGVAPITQPVIAPGETFVYEYTADEVSVAMYHPHFHSQIGLPNGMFGSIFVGETPLPTGRSVGGYDIPADVKPTQSFPMVLNDSGVIGFSLNGKSFPATAPIVAKAGDWVEFTYFNEGTMVHPMHLHQFDQIVIGKDGYTLDQPYLADTVSVAPGERYTVLVKLDKVGTWVWHCHILPHVEDEEGMFGMVTAVVVQ
jgi:plastocyanin